jgi:hypothetical protein
MGMKLFSLSDTLHILKELEYILPIIPHSEEYYFSYHMHTCFSVKLAPPMLNAKILIEDFECMWKIQDREFQEYLEYNIIYGYIVFNNTRGYGLLEHLIGYMGVYVLQYYYKLEVAYSKYYLKHTTIVSHKLTFVMAKRDLILDIIEKKVKEDSMEA